MNKYRLSGRFTPFGIVFALLLGLVIGLPLAFLYGWGIIRIPEVRLACLATLAFGVLLGGATGLGAKWGKVRNLPVAASVAGVSAGVSLYCSWAFWVANVFQTYAHKHLDSLFLIRNPQSLWELIKFINRIGTWGMSQGSATKGTALWVIWSAEAATVLGAAALASIGILQMRAFCESCGVWCSVEEKMCLSPVSDIAQTQLLLKQQNFSFLQTLAPGNKKGTHLEAQLQSCPRCRDLNTLTLRQTFVQPRRFGSPAIKAVNLATKLLLTRPDAEKLRETAQGLKHLSKAAHA